MPDREPHEPKEIEPTPAPLQWLREYSLPIIGLLLVVMTGCLIAHYSSIKIDWAQTHEFTGSIQDIVQTLAIIAGGGWAYFKFIKGRTFRESLVPAVSGRLVSIKSVVHLIVTVQIKNVGLSKVDFDRKGSSLILFEYASTYEKEIHTVADKRLTTFDLLLDSDRYIEPNEVVELQRFVSIPAPLKLAYRMEVEVFSKSGLVWDASCIVDQSAMRDNVIPSKELSEVL